MVLEKVKAILAEQFDVEEDKITADIVVKGKNTPLKTAFAIIDAVSGTGVAEKPHKNA